MSGQQSEAPFSPGVPTPTAPPEPPWAVPRPGSCLSRHGCPTGIGTGLAFCVRCFAPLVRAPASGAGRMTTAQEDVSVWVDLFRSRNEELIGWPTQDVQGPVWGIWTCQRRCSSHRACGCEHWTGVWPVRPSGLAWRTSWQPCIEDQHAMRTARPINRLHALQPAHPESPGDAAHPCRSTRPRRSGAAVRA